MKTTIRFLIACLSLLLGWSTVSQAANTIDPNNIGATDVVKDPTGTPVTLTNPLADPLDLGVLSLAVGDSGSGELLIDNGSSVTNFYGHIARLSGSTGVATVSGSGSLWDTSILNVGYFGTGILNIEAGGVVDSADSSIGREIDSTGAATVAGSGSQWDIGDGLQVGRFGTGALNIEAGGVVNVGGGWIGSRSDSTGTATVTGSGSQWNMISSLLVGSSGTGTLNIEAGGVVSSSGSTIGVWPDSTGTATVSGSGSQWNTSNNFTVGREGIGTLNITGGGTVSVGGTLAIDSLPSGDGVINMSTGGMLALFGEADESLSAFVTLIDGSYIRYWDNNIADWSHLKFATYGDDYTLSYLTTGDLTGYTLLTVGIQGDFDGNGVVDGNDLLVWQLDPSVGSLSAWETNYGMAAPISAVSATVPEPTTCTLALAALCLAMSRRRIAAP